MSERFELLRVIEAALFASAEPMTPNMLAKVLPEGTAVEELLEELAGLYANRGVNLLRVGPAWAFRTAGDVAPKLQIQKKVERRMSRAAVDTLAIVAYHQPVTRAEIEEIRGVALSKGTLDTLLEAGWIRPRGRRRTPGRPLTWGTSTAFLDHFGLESLNELPGLDELKASGLIDSRPAAVAVTGKKAAHFMKDGEDVAELEPDEDALDHDFGEDLLDEDADEDLAELLAESLAEEAHGPEDDDDEDEDSEDEDVEDEGHVRERGAG